MKITVTTTSQGLPTIMGENFAKLVKDFDGKSYNLTIQNLGGTDIYLEKNDPATVSDGYKLLAGSEVDMMITKIDKLNLISDASSNTDVRLITT